MNFYVDAHHAIESGWGEDNYHQFELTSAAMLQLAMIIRNELQIRQSWQVIVGDCEVHILITVQSVFTAEEFDNGKIQIISDRESLIRFANELDQMADVPLDPDYLVHLHLDTYFTRRPTKFSDIVIQRIDDFHKADV